MPAIDLFSPIGNTVNVSATTSSARVARTALGHVAGAEIRVANTGSTLAFVEFGDSTVTASTTTSMPILPGTVEVFEVNPLQTHIAAITGTGTTTIYITSGRGA